MDYRELDSRDRRLIIVASPERALELSRRIDWKAVATRSLPLASAAWSFTWRFTSGPVDIFLYKVLKGEMQPPHPLGDLRTAREVLKVQKNLPYPLFDLRTVRDQFNFPINHPIDGLAYVCCEAEPNLYVPLASFHQYMYEAKLAAFHELCANLGVHRCTVVYAEEDGQDITMRVRASGIPTQIGPVSGGLSTSATHRSSETTAVFAEYPSPNRPLTEIRSGWMNGEPT